MVVADTLSLAIKGAHTVKVSYKNRQKPILTIKEALLQPERIKDSKRPQPFSDPIPSGNKYLYMSFRYEPFHTILMLNFCQNQTWSKCQENLRLDPSTTSIWKPSLLL